MADEEYSRSPGASSRSVSTAVTSPLVTADIGEDDIWADDNNDSNTGVPSREEVLSDLPTMKRQHMTDGYREGLSVGKAKVMQDGFDQGYPIGVQIAVRVGTVLGVLEGYIACKSINVIPGMQDLVQRTYEKARKELSITALLEDAEEDALSKLQVIPSSTLAVIKGWEATVIGVWKTRQQTQKVQERPDRHELPKVVEDAERKDPPAVKDDSTS